MRMYWPTDWTLQISPLGQIASPKIGETILQVTTPTPLKQGQIVQLELVQTADKPLLKLIPSSEIPLPTTKTADASLIKLVPGQQVAVEVVKLLSENRVLAQTTPPVQLHLVLRRLSQYNLILNFHNWQSRWKSSCRGINNKTFGDSVEGWTRVSWTDCNRSYWVTTATTWG